MVSTVQENSIGTQPLVGVEEQSNFGRPRATVDKISVEEICMFIRRVAIPAEDLQKVEELTYIPLADAPKE